MKHAACILIHFYPDWRKNKIWPLYISDFMENNSIKVFTTCKRLLKNHNFSPFYFTSTIKFYIGGRYIVFVQEKSLFKFISVIFNSWLCKSEKFSLITTDWTSSYNLLNLSLNISNRCTDCFCIFIIECISEVLATTYKSEY